jgi:hypothetical protein
VTVERFEPASDVDRVPASTRDALRAVLVDVEAFARRFLATLTDDHFAVLAAWIVHTYVVEHGYATPYLHVTSAERSSGKTRLLEILDLLCFRSSGLVLDPSAAAVFRELDSGDVVTFLLDEVDNYLAPGKVDSEARRAVLSILNGGYTKGATVARTLGAGTKGEKVKRYRVFGPKALSGIGELPPTLASRSLRLPLKKRTSSEPVERLRLRHVTPQAKELRGRIAAVFADETVGAYLEQAEREVEELEDRLVDAVELMVALADLAGSEWPERIRQAVVSVAAGTAEAVADASLGLRLLEDLHAITIELGGDRFPTAILLERLNALEESPWGGFSDGRGLAARELARRLKPYGIRSTTFRIPDGGTPKGYVLDELKEAFGRYLAENPQQAQLWLNDAGLSRVSDPQHDGSVADAETAANSHGYADVSDVAAQRPKTRLEELGEPFREELGE